jgi:hypothetical protein
MKKHGVHYHCYADDTSLYMDFNSRDPTSKQCAIRRLELCLEEINSWMVSNKLKLNSEKTEFLLITSRYHQTLVDKTSSGIFVGDTIILPKKTVKCLGVTLDAEMTMTSYVNQITRSAYYHLRNIHIIRHFLDEVSCTAAVRALVISRLDYANSLLAGISDISLRKLQVVQNNAARMITGTPRRNHITPVLHKLHWLPVKQRVSYKLLLLTFNALHSEYAPEYLTELLTHRECIRTTRSVNENSLMLYIPRAKKIAGDRSFVVAAPRLWNKLPTQVCGTQSLGVFKTGLKTFLFRQHFH